MYEVLLLPPAQKDLDKLAAPVFDRLVKKIRDLRKNARPLGSLKLTSDDGYRIRVGDYRVLYRVDDTLIFPRNSGHEEKGGLH